MSDQLTTDEVAALAGIARRSFEQARARGTAPEPDGYLGRTPWWTSETVEAWLASRRRPGRPATTLEP